MMYAVGKRDGDGFLLVSFDGMGVVGFESKFDAEDFADTLDLDGEFEAVEVEDDVIGTVAV